MSILVCGGAGYIGSHTVHELVKQNKDVIIVDNLQSGHMKAVNPKTKFYKGDIRDAEFLDKVFSENTIEAIIHFAANSLVGESMVKPLLYFNNNVYGMQILLESMVKHNIKNIVFSSTAAVYGEPKKIPISEDDETNPTNTYGETKLTMEKMMKWVSKANGINYVSLRYFNVAGALEDGSIGEDHSPETHLIPLILQVPLKKREHITIYGEDYDTDDGTCIRDYIHVLDLADAHIRALEYLLKGNESNIFNLGNGLGFSVKEMIDAATDATNEEIKVVIGERRPGDPAKLVASSEKAQKILGWTPKYTNMKDINLEINRLTHFAIKKHLITYDDVIYATNMLLGTLNLTEFEVCTIEENIDTPTPILENILDYACMYNLIEDTITERDLFDTKIMNCVMPRPSEVISKFNKLYSESQIKATEYYYNFSIASNYIRKERIDKNIVWKVATEYGDLDITINLSKPEKDPRDIAKATLIKSSSYPKCLLCKENEGFYGNLNHPARQTLRVIPLDFDANKYFLQYSPYTYYNEHCIIFNTEHIPMKINKDTFRNLLLFTDILPHYFAGSNADLPIVGGSILSHDHYQGGNYTFAMEKAPIEKRYIVDNYEDIEIGSIKWPMSVIRLASTNKNKLLDLADHILSSWRNYSDESVNIISHTSEEPHNTITPIARIRDGKYELDLVLRNNRTSAEHPFGIFHPHDEVHHIKKENIGLIEVMGLAVLPARLNQELTSLKKYLVSKEVDILNDEMVAKHSNWYKYLLEKHTDISQENIDDILKQEVGLKFLDVLCHAGVFKRDESGLIAFDKFINTL